MSLHTLLITSCNSSKLKINTIYRSKTTQNIYSIAGPDKKIISNSTDITLTIINVQSAINHRQVVDFTIFIPAILESPNIYIGLYDIVENKIQFAHGMIELNDCTSIFLTWFNGDTQLIYANLQKWN